jgi:hypothetical protein
MKKFLESSFLLAFYCYTILKSHGLQLCVVQQLHVFLADRAGQQYPKGFQKRTRMGVNRRAETNGFVPGSVPNGYSARDVTKTHASTDTARLENEDDADVFLSQPICLPIRLDTK